MEPPATEPHVDRPVVAAVRLFAGFAAFGAASVDLALSSSFFAGGAGTPGAADYVAGGVAGLWGAGLLAGGVACLARGRVPGKGAAATILGIAAILHVAAIVLSTTETSVLNLSHLAALLLTLMIMAAVAWLRRQTDQGQIPVGAGSTAQPGRLLLGAFAGAVLVAGIATPGLAASTAGQFAVPHGEHGTAPPPGGHHQR